MYTRIYTHTHTYVKVCVCKSVHVCISVYEYTRVYLCMYVHTHPVEGGELDDFGILFGESKLEIKTEVKIMVYRVFVTLNLVVDEPAYNNLLDT
jgi:hypothetical protein